MVGEEQSEIVSFGLDRTDTLINSQQLWLCAVELYKIEPAKILAWSQKVFMNP